MKVWLVIFRADPEAQAAGVEDGVFFAAYQTLTRAKSECIKHLDEMEYEEGQGRLKSGEIEWSGPIREGPYVKVIGRPKAEADGTFDLYQVEVVK